MAVGRSAAAEKSHGCKRANLVPGSRRYQHSVACLDFAEIVFKFHQAASFEDEIEFLAELVIMPFRGLSRWNGGLREALVANRCVRAVENASNGRTIFCGEGFLAG